MTTSLYRVALDWMRDDREHRYELERQGKKRRGARASEVELEISFCTSLTLGFRVSRLIQRFSTRSAYVLFPV